MLTQEEARKKYPFLSSVAESTGRTLATYTSIFIVLKLVGVITWSWWLVFLPTIIRYTLFGLLTLVAAASLIVLRAQKETRVRV